MKDKNIADLLFPPNEFTARLLQNGKVDSDQQEFYLCGFSRCHSLEKLSEGVMVSGRLAHCKALYVLCTSTKEVREVKTVLKMRTANIRLRLIKFLKFKYQS